MLQNTRKTNFSCMWLILGANLNLVILVPFDLFDQKKSFNSNQTYTKDLHPFLFEKKNFLDNS